LKLLFYVKFDIVLHHFIDGLASRSCGLLWDSHMPRKTKTGEGIALGVRIGRNIKVARLRLGMTQSTLAEALDIENVTVSRIETGAQLPSVDRLDEIAAVLKVSLAMLLADSTKKEAFGELLGEAVKDLPLREKEFVYGFAVQYAQHWRAGKKK
jgi:transcriptional regulator with XRE-family HTH domain